MGSFMFIKIFFFQALSRKDQLMFLRKSKTLNFIIYKCFQINKAIQLYDKVK